MFRRDKRISMIDQIALLFVIGVLIVGGVSYFVLLRTAQNSVIDNLISRGYSSSTDLETFIDQYPAHDWLMAYWCENYDKLDIEYDVDYSKGNETSEKFMLLDERYPEFLLDYATADEVEALPPEDQKMYAEIIYSWLITRMNQMAVSYDIDYLFCIVTDERCEDAMILFITAKKDLERGTEPGQLYPIGTSFKVSKVRQEAMKSAIAGEPKLAPNDDGKYIDYLYSIGSVNGYEFLIGVTDNISKTNQEIRNLSVRLSTLFMLLLVAMTAACLLMVSFVILRPLRTIQSAIRTYRDNKDSEAVIKSLRKLNSQNELGQLSEDFADLAKEIHNYTTQLEHITSERERINTELTLASNIQQAMVPREFRMGSEQEIFELVAATTPAKEVGGDFYDAFMIDDDHLCMIIADVSGKGIPAALYVMACKITLSYSCPPGKTPSEILASYNEEICARNPEEMFVTMWLGILDIRTGKLTAANAGHENPVVMHPGGWVELITLKHDFVVGGMSGMKYHDYEIQMTPGTSLFLYTDGLTEASDNQGKMFGENRVLKQLNKDCNATPDNILQHMTAEAEHFVREAEQFDDLTMMCVKYNGKTDL